MKDDKNKRKKNDKNCERAENTNTESLFYIADDF